MKNLRIIIAILISVLFINCHGTAQQQKNVILFVVDDLGYHDLSMNGSKLYETPNVDKLAANGISFTKAYVSHPRCVPSRYSIQTGKFPARAQIPGGKDNKLQKNDISIGQAFKNHGYRTFFAGKWHLGKKEEDWPQNKGYDVNKGGCSAGAPISYFFPYNESKGKNQGKHKKIVGLDDGKPGEYLTDRLTEEAVKFINESDGPFFAMLSHYGVHTPFQAPKELVKKYRKKLGKMHFEGPEYIMKDGQTKMHQDNAVYAAMIETVDNSLGAIVKALEDKGILENTIIIFTSDHGGLSNRGVNSTRKLATSNLPLRAGKGHVYEGGVKVPFIIYDKEFSSKSKCGQVTVNTDIYPTLLDLCGLPLLPGQHLDGMSMKPFLQGNKTVERTLYWHSPRGRPKQTGDHDCSAIRIGDLKLIDYYKDDRVELYDLKKDPYESENLAASEMKIAKKFQKELVEWKKKINAVE